MNYRFTYQGSAPDAYQVEVRKAGRNITCTCTCKGATFGNLCKHRSAILVGNGEGFEGATPAILAEIEAALEDSDVADAIFGLKKAEADLKMAKKRLVAALLD